MENGSPNHRRHLRDYPVRTQDRPESRRRDCRLALVGARLPGQRRADAAGTARHSDDGESLSRDLPRDRRSVPREVPDHEVAEHPYSGRVERTAPACGHANHGDSMMMSPRLFRVALLALSTASPAFAQSDTTRSTPALQDAFHGTFRIGTALAPRQFNGDDKRVGSLIRTHFNAISPENVLKWEVVHPLPDIYNFGLSDRYVEFGEKNGMFIVGHTLAWHSQTPRWVFEDSTGKPLTRAALLQRLHEHIEIVVGRYKGRVNGWDVVNEALNEDGTLRNTPWLRIIGPDFIEKAFQFAHEADPGAELYYNDYALENANKRRGCVKLISGLLAKGIKVTAIGMKDHLKMNWPTVAEEDSTISAFSALGVKVNITELDVDVLPPATRSTGADVSQRAVRTASLDPYTAGLPDSVQQALASRYEEEFRVFMSNRAAIDRITFWGGTDGDSCLNRWPVPGRTSHPLLLDRAGKPKPAFHRVVGVAAESTSAR